MNENKKLYSTVAEMTGLSQAYIRELLNRGKIDKSIKIKGTKAGKEWRIDTQSVYEYLGVQKSTMNYEKDLHIKELENQIRIYKGQLEYLKGVLQMINEII